MVGISDAGDAIEQAILFVMAVFTFNTGVLAFQSNTFIQAYAPAGIASVSSWVALGTVALFVWYFMSTSNGGGGNANIPNFGGGR